MPINVRHGIQVLVGAVLTALPLPVFAAESGLPQLNADTYPSQVFWLIISFVLLYILMSKIALPRVHEVFELRSSEIANNLSRAEKFQQEMEEVKASYEESLAKANQDAEDIVKTIEQKTAAKISDKHHTFSEEAKSRLQKTEDNIEQARAEVLKSLEGVAADVTKDALKKLAGISVKKADMLKVVQSNVKELA